MRRLGLGGGTGGESSEEFSSRMKLASGVTLISPSLWLDMSAPIEISSSLFVIITSGSWSVLLLLLDNVELRLSVEELKKHSLFVFLETHKNCRLHSNVVQ